MERPLRFGDKKMESLTSNLLSAIERRNMTAHVYKDSHKTDIIIEYFPRTQMHISGLKPEFPPYIWFKDDGIYSSKDNKEWKKAPRESGYEVLKLFDPRAVLKQTHVDKEFENGFSGTCSVTAVTGMESLDKYFSDEELRNVYFELHKGLLSEMRRKDFPPNKDDVKLVFSYTR